jgi:hypothetical protein
MLNLVEPLVPRDKVTPDDTDKAEVTVMVFPAVAGTRLQLPLTVKLNILMLGTAVIAAD